MSSARKTFRRYVLEVFTQNKSENEYELLDCVRCHGSSLLLYKVALVCRWGVGGEGPICKVTSPYVEGLLCIISSDKSNSTVNIILQHGRRWALVFV